MPNTIPPYQKTAYTISAILVLIIVVCLLWIFLKQPSGSSGVQSGSKQITADIYQNGNLLQSIDLSAVTESYSFTLEGENNCYNEIQVCPGSIGITAANCPDMLCVHQGFINSSLLPITCLPNRVVIRIRSNEITTDIISY